jgi:hypothetical protein
MHSKQANKSKSYQNKCISDEKHTYQWNLILQIQALMNRNSPRGSVPWKNVLHTEHSPVKNSYF